MLQSKLVTCFLLAMPVVCRARQLASRLDLGSELNRLDKSRMVEVVQKKTDSRPVDMEALFWSYFHRGSVERAGLFTGGYTRASPGQWEGRASMRSNRGEEVMLLGEMARVSEGPRRRKRGAKRAQGGKEVNQFEEFFSQRDGARLKREEDNAKTTKVDPAHNWQRKGIFHPNALPTVPRDQWRACTRLCDGSHPPPGFPPCCAALEHQLDTEPLTTWGHWVDATEHFVDSYPLAVIAIQTVFSIAVINVLVSRLSRETVDVSGRSWETEEQEEESERLLLQVLDGSWLAALEEHAMEKKRRRTKGESYICCLLNEGEEEQVECFTQPRYSSGEKRQFRFSQFCHYMLAPHFGRQQKL